ncbi:MAG TPA: cobalt ECF transporter T component CbiQ [bacterium]|nr:cobalt ECF transporter T component CbiQ [bacterium]
MFEERFEYGNSILHGTDPRVKLVLALLFSVVTAVGFDMRMLWFALLFSVLMSIAAKLNPIDLALRLLIVNGFIFFIWLVLPWSFPGDVVFSAGPLNITRQGLDYCLMITVKSNAIVIANIALLSTSPLVNLVHAMSHLKVPSKLIHIFFFSIRYIHVIQSEYRRLVNAAKVRCFSPGTNMHTYRTYAYLAGMLLINSYDRSRRVLDAMKCRGFKGRYYVLDHFEFGYSDIFVTVTGIIVVLVLSYMEWGIG